MSTRIIPKRDAVERFFALWDRFQHIGDVPDELERQIILNENANGGSTAAGKLEQITQSLGGRMAAEDGENSPKVTNDQCSDDGQSSCGDSPSLVRCILSSFGYQDSAPVTERQKQLLYKTFKWLIDTGCGHDLVSIRDAQKLD